MSRHITQEQIRQIVSPKASKKAKDQRITIALAYTNGKRERAANLLGISTRNLYREIERRIFDDVKN